MLHNKAPGAAAHVERPSVGNLFVPTRVTPQAPKSPSAPPAGDSTICHVASVPTQHVADLFDLHLRAPVAPVAPAAATTTPKLRLSWAGSGIYFWWQLGAVHYLLQQYDLSKVPARGASGGGLAAVLSTCGVDPLQVMESAYQLSVDHNIWERPLGLLGTWGGLIEQWLHDLLPDDAVERCRNKVGLVVTELPSCQQVAISDFTSKEDLINVAMASAHVPWLLDWKASRTCRGVQCVDGSFPDFFTGANCDLLTFGGESVCFDYFDDPKLIRQGRMDMLQLKQYKEIKRICMLGYKYAQRLHDEGAFARFDCEAVKRRL